MPKSLKILAFDTTSGGLTIAVTEDEKILAKKELEESGMQSEMLIPLIEDCLNKAKIWYQDLNLIAFAKGPGSFTGVRVGLSTAKALSLASDLSLIGVGSLEAIAFDYRNSDAKKILVAIDAKLDEFFIQEFEVKDGKIKPVFEAKLIAAADLENNFPQTDFVLAGTSKNDKIKAENIALIALNAYQNQENFSSEALYVRQPKITKRKSAVKKS